MDRPSVQYADIDTSAMSREEQLFDMKCMGLLAKEARGELTHGLKKFLVATIAAEQNCDVRTVWRHLESRQYQPQFNSFVISP